MIRYSLLCEKEHEFEGWFGSSDDYDRQRKKRLVECPACGSAKIEKALMTPGVSTARKKTEGNELATAAQKLSTNLRISEQTGGQMSGQMSGLAAEQRELISKMRELRDKVTANAEDVGDRFSEEARKIHYGDAEARGIFGKTDLEEAVKLVDEGIEIFPLPDLPEDKN